MFRTKKQRLVVLSFLLVFSVQFVAAKVYAQTASLDQALASSQDLSCGEGLTYSGLVQTNPDVYSIYVKLGQKGVSSPANLIFQSYEGGCRQIGSAMANSDTWQLIGQWDARAEKPLGSMLLQGNLSNGILDANKPGIMLVSQTNPVCQPTDECYVTIQGQRGYVRGTTQTASDSLYVMNVSDPASASIKGVDYYIDDKQAYSLKSLEPFNLRYVPAGNHTLSRVITYSDNQRVVMTEKTARDFSNILNYTFFSFVYGNHTTLAIVASITGLLLFGSLLLMGMHVFFKRRLWRKEHFNTTKQKVSSRPYVTPRLHIYRTSDISFWIRSACMIGAVCFSAIILVFLLNAFIFQFFSVDGPSMQKTLFTGQHLFVSKTGKTWARITGNKYLPKRGEVVIAKQPGSSGFQIPGQQGQSFVVKRVIGLPGDTVEVKNGSIKVTSSDGKNAINPDEGHAWSKNIQAAPPEQSILVKLEPGEIFIVGDNRPESVDSRSYGSVSADEIVGRAVFRVSPFTRL